MKKVVVGSANPVKIAAAKNGFEKMFKEEQFEVVGVNVDSGVPDQPFGDEETLQGAKNRAKAAAEVVPDADYSVGMEGGIMERDDGWVTCAWHVVMSGGEVIGRAKTAEVFLPKKTVELVKQGKELSHANDEVFGMENSKHSEGMTGILTGGLLPRAVYYETAFYLALAPLKHKAIY